MAVLNWDTAHTGRWRSVDRTTERVSMRNGGRGPMRWRYYKFSDLSSIATIRSFAEGYGWEYVYTWETKGAEPPYQCEFRRALSVAYLDEPNWEHVSYRIPGTR